MSDPVSILSTGIDVNVVSESDTAIYLITAGQQGANASINDLGTPSNRFVIIGNGTTFDSRLLAAADLPTSIDAANLADGSVSNTEFLNLNGTTSNIQTQLDSKASITYASDASNLSSGTLSVARLPSAIPATNIANGTVDNAEFQTLNGVTSSIQTQLDGKAAISYVDSQDSSTLVSAQSYASNASNITSGTVAPARLGSGTATSSTLLDGSGVWRGLTAADIPSLDASKIETGTLSVSRLNSGSSSQFIRSDGTNSNILTGPIQVTDGVSGTGNHTFFPATSIGSDDSRAVLFGGGTATFTASRGGFIIVHGVNHASEASNILIRPGVGGVTKVNQPNSSNVAVQIDSNGITLPNSPFIKGNSSNNTVICTGTSTGTDDKIAYLFGGGTTTPTGSRGAYFGAHGANHATRPNVAFISSGTSGSVQLALDNSVRLTLDSATSQIQISNFPLVLGSAATIVAASNSIAGTASGVQINAPTASAILLQTNGTTRATCGVNGMVFASNATAVLSTNISVGSGAANTLSLNAPTGGSVNTLVAGTSRLNVSATAATLTVPLVTPTATPASASAAGTAGQWAWDSGFLYICTATNTWRRVAHATW